MGKSVKTVTLQMIVFEGDKLTNGYFIRIIAIFTAFETNALFLLVVPFASITKSPG